MTHKPLIRRLSLSLAMLLPAISYAHKGGPGLPPEFDLNGDGTITATEIQTALAADFVKIDTNADSYISLSELIAFHQSKLLTRFNTLDTDVSASLSLAEFTAANTQLSTAEATELFTLVDTDANSALSLDEFSVLEPGKGEIIRHFAHADTDADAKLTQTEFLAGPGGHGGHNGNSATSSTSTTSTATSTSKSKTKKAKK